MPPVVLNGLPENWSLTTVSEVGAVQVGMARSAARQSGQWPTKYLRAGNITTHGLDLSDVLTMDFAPHEREVFSLHRGDIVLAEASGSPSHVGRAALWEGAIPECCFQNTVIRFRPHAVEPEYALLVFRHYVASRAFANVARGVGIQHLSGSRFASMPFPLPPVDEQTRIVTETERRLQLLREGVASLRSALDKTNEQVREILASAVAGTLLGRNEIELTLTGRTADDGLSLLRRLQNSANPQRSLLSEDSESPSHVEEIGTSLPTHWAWARMCDAGEIIGGRQVSPANRSGPHPRKYLRVANVYEDRIDLTDVKEMNFSRAELEIYRLEPGDVLLNEGQSIELVGRAAIFRGELQDVCFQNTLIRFRARPGVSPEYALLVFRHYLHSGRFRKIARRSTNIAHLGVNRFSALPFPLPPSDEQSRIAHEARARLAASDAQHRAVGVALERAEVMERELLGAAVTGAMRLQLDSDETATDFLLRRGPAAAAESGRRIGRLQKGATSVKRTGIRKVRSIADVLHEAGRPLNTAELFALAGYDRDSTDEVEAFFLSLRALLGSVVRVTGKKGEDATVELTNAP